MFRHPLILIATALLAFELLVACVGAVRTGAWWVRVCDFPRIQLIVLLSIPLILVVVHALLAGVQRGHLFLASITLTVAAVQSARVLPYTPLWKVELPNCSAESPHLRVLMVNLEFDNERREEAARAIREQDADLLLLMELNEPWADALAPLLKDYPHRIEEVRGEGLGIGLWSRLPLVDPSIRYLVSDRRPSILSDVDLPGDMTFRFVGLHPTPPGLNDSTPGGRRDSRVRDAELVIVAREVADDPKRRWMVAGDFNDVAWSHTTRLFRRISGLADPRIGRGLFNSYHTDHPYWRFPIDQLYLSQGASVRGLKRVKIPGSDHFALSTEVHFASTDGVEPIADNDDLEEGEEILEEGEQDAEERGIDSDSPESSRPQT